MIAFVGVYADFCFNVFCSCRFALCAYRFAPCLFDSLLDRQAVIVSALTVRNAGYTARVPLVLLLFARPVQYASGMLRRKAHKNGAATTAHAGA